MSTSTKKEGFAGQKLYVMPSLLVKKAKEHILCKGLYITDIGFYPNALFHNRERKKGCPQYILLYCTKGQGWYTINQEKYSLKANQMVILPAKKPHQYGADIENPWTIYWIHFTGDQATFRVNHLLKSNYANRLTVSFDEERNNTFEKLFSLLQVAGNMDNMIDVSLLFSYYLNSFKQASIPDELIETHKSALDQSIAFMKTQLSTTLTLAALAKQASLSVSHYSALFKQKTNNSPVSYFVFLKMQHACKLLENTALSIQQIAVELGYNDPFHFSRAFSKLIGISPSKFRKR